jgi:hypothetical protein
MITVQMLPWKMTAENNSVVHCCLADGSWFWMVGLVDMPKLCVCQSAAHIRQPDLMISGQFLIFGVYYKYPQKEQYEQYR